MSDESDFAQSSILRISVERGYHIHEEQSINVLVAQTISGRQGRMQLAVHKHAAATDCKALDNRERTGQTDEKMRGSIGNRMLYMLGTMCFDLQLEKRCLDVVKRPNLLR